MVADSILDTPAAPGSLLASSRELPYTFEQWRRGLVWSATDSRIQTRGLGNYPGAAENPNGPLVLQDCVNPPCRLPNANEAPSPVAAWPYWLSHQSNCDLSEIDWQQRLSSELNSGSSAALAYALWTGKSAGTFTPSASFASKASDLNLAARGPVECLARLIAAVTAVDTSPVGAYTSRIVFHVTAEALPTLMDHGLVRLDGNIYRFGAHIVVLDAGYPRDLPGQAPTAINECYVVASGQIETALGPISFNQGSPDPCDTQVWEAHRFGFARFQGFPGTHPGPKVLPTDPDVLIADLNTVFAARMLLWQ